MVYHFCKETLILVAIKPRQNFVKVASNILLEKQDVKAVFIFYITEITEHKHGIISIGKTLCNRTWHDKYVMAGPQRLLDDELERENNKKKII